MKILIYSVIFFGETYLVIPTFLSNYIKNAEEMIHKLHLSYPTS